MKDKTVQDNQAGQKTKYEAFLRLFRANEDRLFGFTLKMLPNFAVAEDIMQETMMTMWRKFDEFQEGTSFSAWGIKIARYKIMEFHQQNKKAGIVYLSDEILRQMSDDDRPGKLENSYFEALHHCVEKLKDQNHRIIKLRYSRQLSVKQIAGELSVSVNVIYKSMAKIHCMLQQCIEKVLSV
jgi:RNA polymerase sigma-70 factor (ECF subfamily)